MEMGNVSKIQLPDLRADSSIFADDIDLHVHKLVQIVIFQFYISIHLMYS